MNLESELTAADLILALIDSAADPALPASYLVETGQMFGLDAGAIRVALTRLVKRNVLAQVERGRYGLGKSGDPLHQAVRNWGDAEQRLISWKGDWIAVSAVHLSRRNKTQVRRREKALRFFGLAQAAPGLWIRPANLREDFTSLRRSLCAIAGDQLDDWWLYRLSDLLPRDAFDPTQLWNIAELEQSYRTLHRELKQSLECIDKLARPDAAKETLLIGRAVTRAILIDPVLPAQMIDASARSSLIDLMRQYDRVGKQIWRTLFEDHQSKTHSA
jgi:phenylacetic acid degradation operon negative regulatory protein